MQYLFLFIGTAMAVALDQLTKLWAVRALVPSGQLPADASDIRTQVHAVTDSWFNLKVAGNKGAAWGLFRSLPEEWRVAFFVVISLVAIGVIVMLYRKAAGQPLLRVALGLILGGAIGNLADRIRLGFVVDFIDWYWKNSHWPTFNVADVYISVGVGLLLIDMLLQGKRAKAPSGDPLEP